MITPRPGSHRDKTSKWSSRRRDLATPQGSNIVSAFLLCAIVAIVFDVVGRRVFGLPQSVLYPTIVIVNVAILVVAAFRISAINKQAEAARRPQPGHPAEHWRVCVQHLDVAPLSGQLGDAICE